MENPLSQNLLFLVMADISAIGRQRVKGNIYGKTNSRIHHFLPEFIAFNHPRSSLLWTFRAEERLRLSGRNFILMMQINVYIIKPVVRS